MEFSLGENVAFVRFASLYGSREQIQRRSSALGACPFPPLFR